MWPFNRNNGNNIPTEIKEYYQAERRDRAGMAWLLAIVTFVATAITVLILFVGGRWAYGKLTNKQPSKPTASVSQQEQDKRRAAEEEKKKQSARNNPSPPSSNSGTATPPAATPTPTPSPAPTPAPAPAPAPAPTPQPAPSTRPSTPAPTPAPAPAPQPQPQPAVASATSSIPNTGPAEVIALFAGTVIFAAMGHYVALRKGLIK